jgi:riboflavin synthase
MFTGLVEEQGVLASVEPDGDGAHVRIRAEAVLQGAVPGDSIAVDGCCLTVEALGPDWFAARAVPETLRCTTLGQRATGDAVDLERPVRPTDRLGGHVVQGHVDGIGHVRRADELGDGSRWLEVALPDGLDRYVVVKGSIALDGVSLTVAAAGPGWCGVAIVPHTGRVTVLGRRGVGDACNVEVDCLAKHVERLLEASGALGPRSLGATGEGGR